MPRKLSPENEARLVELNNEDTANMFRRAMMTDDPSAYIQNEAKRLLNRKEANKHRDFWWLAINGASCAASPCALRPSVEVIPTPEQLLGFPTRDEQIQVQTFLLTAPINDVERFLVELTPRVLSGEVEAIRPENPQPPTEGPTQWIVQPAIEPDATGDLVVMDEAHHAWRS